MSFSTEITESEKHKLLLSPPISDSCKHLCVSDEGSQCAGTFSDGNTEESPRDIMDRNQENLDRNQGNMDRRRFMSKSDGNLAAGHDPLQRLKLENTLVNDLLSFKSSRYDFFDEEEEEDEVSSLHYTEHLIQDPVEKHNTTLTYSILILLVNVGLFIMATFVFMYYENKGRRIANDENYITLEHFRTHVPNRTYILDKLLMLQKQQCRKSNDRVGGDWEYWGAFQYCNTVITTLGYGLVYPHTSISKYITMAYALFGIPLYLAYINYFVEYFTFAMSAVEVILLHSKRCKWLVRTTLRVSVLRLLVMTVILLFYLGVHLWITFPPVRDWEEKHMKLSLLDMAYWQTIRFTTIGFGDIVILLNNDTPKLMLSTLLMLPLGIAYMTTFYEFIRTMTGKRKLKDALFSADLPACKLLRYCKEK